MTQTICAVEDFDGGQRPPFQIQVTLICEGDHGLFGVPAWSHTGPDYMAIRANATKDGWKRSDNKWLCPGCAK